MSDRPFIAVVDDDPSVCKALQRLLRTAQLEVETHASGKEFLVALERREPDCLVLDLRMPGMTGPELSDRLTSMGRRIPIVFITAHAEDMPSESAAAAAAPDVLHKPFDDTALLDAIGRALQQRRTP
jgi:FixJ family two-component response regulator